MAETPKKVLHNGEEWYCGEAQNRTGLIMYRLFKEDGTEKVVSAFEFKAADNLYDPLHDEKTPYTIRQFEQILSEGLADWAKSFEGANPYTSQPHTFNEWLQHLSRFMINPL